MSEHRLRLRQHPEKPWIQLNWSFERKRFYKKRATFVYCIDCKNFAWGLYATHPVYMKDNK